MNEVNNNAIVVTASHMIKANSETLFVPHLDNFYEQWLYENAEKATGISHFYTGHFNQSDFKGHLDAVESCFDKVMRQSGLYRKINKKRSSRIGVIYFDQYGPVSFFNKDAQIKEMYYSDVFPSFILNAHNISGYSIRLRAERCSLFQALETAQTLIHGGELDMVIVGGVYQCIPYLFLTDMVDDYQWLKRSNALNKHKASALHLSDATGFLLLESSIHAEQRSADVKAELSSILCHSNKDDSEGIKVNSAFAYPFMQNEFNSTTSNASLEFIDMGCMTAFNALLQSIDNNGPAEAGNITASDRDNYSWTLKINHS